MSAVGVTARLSGVNHASPRLRALHRRTCLAEVVRTVGCPGCDVKPGESCVSRSGEPTSPHILRTNLAKRESTPGECPLGCGDQLQIVKHMIGHVRSGLFECAPTPEGDNRG